MIEEPSLNNFVLELGKDAGWVLEPLALTNGAEIAGVHFIRGTVDGGMKEFLSLWLAEGKLWYQHTGIVKYLNGGDGDRVLSVGSDSEFIVMADPGSLAEVEGIFKNEPVLTWGNTYD